MLSLDISNFCSKQCSFCYSHSTKIGSSLWTSEEVIYFLKDCIKNGIKAVSLGGGEPFEYDDIFIIIREIYPHAYLSITSNGLALEDENIWEQLLINSPDKIHITIHYPDDIDEVNRVISTINKLKATKIKAGVNLLVSKDKISACRSAYTKLLKILNEQEIILVPQRFSNTPTPEELASVAAGHCFQSPSCLLGCIRPSNFCSVSWDKRVNSCSFAGGKAKLDTLDFEGLISALYRVKWRRCH